MDIKELPVWTFFAEVAEGYDMEPVTFANTLLAEWASDHAPMPEGFEDMSVGDILDLTHQAK